MLKQGTVSSSCPSVCWDCA